MIEECRFPGNAPATAYSKGCRCDGCCDSHRDKARRLREANPEAYRKAVRLYYWENREARREALRLYRRENREAVAESLRVYREENHAARAAGARRRARGYVEAAPAIVTGCYSEAEDAVVVAWRYSLLALAQALGRTRDSVAARRRRLRREGVQLACDQP